MENKNTGIHRFTLLMLGHKKNHRESMLLSSTKGEKKRIEL